MLVNVPVILVVSAAVWVFAPTSRDPDVAPLGAVLSLMGLGSPIYGIIEGPARGWTNATVLVAFVVAVAGLGRFWPGSGAVPIRCCRWACSATAD